MSVSRATSNSIGSDENSSGGNLRERLIQTKDSSNLDLESGAGPRNPSQVVESIPPQSVMVTLGEALGTRWANSHLIESLRSSLRATPTLPSILAEPIDPSGFPDAFADGGADKLTALTNAQRADASVVVDKRTLESWQDNMGRDTTALAKSAEKIERAVKVGCVYIVLCMIAHIGMGQWQIFQESATFEDNLDNAANSSADSVRSNSRADAELANVKMLTEYVTAMYCIFIPIVLVQAVALIGVTAITAVEAYKKVSEVISTYFPKWCAPQKVMDSSEGESDDMSVDLDDELQVLPEGVGRNQLPTVDRNQKEQFTSIAVVKDVISEARTKLFTLDAASIAIYGYATAALAKYQQRESYTKSYKYAVVVLAVTLYISAIAGPAIYRVVIANDRLDGCEKQNSGLDDDLLSDSNVFKCIVDETFYAMVEDPAVRNLVAVVKGMSAGVLGLSSASLLFDSDESPVAVPMFNSELTEHLVVDSASNYDADSDSSTEVGRGTFTQGHERVDLTNLRATYSPSSSDVGGEEESKGAGGVATDRLQAELAEISRAVGNLRWPGVKLDAGSGTKIDVDDLSVSIGGYSDRGGIDGYVNTAMKLNDPSSTEELQLDPVAGRRSMRLHDAGIVATHSRNSEHGVVHAAEEAALAGLLNDFAQVLRSDSVEGVAKHADQIMVTHEALMTAVRELYMEPLDPRHKQVRIALARVLHKMSNVGNQELGLRGAARPGLFSQPLAPVTIGLKPALESALCRELDVTITAGKTDSAPLLNVG